MMEKCKQCVKRPCVHRLLSVPCIHADIRDLISVEDVMEDKVLRCGPNGGLVFCME